MITRKILSYLIYVIMFAFVHSSVLAQSNPVTWYYLNIPPYHIDSGPLQGTGITDELIKNWADVNPDIDHLFFKGNIPRIVATLKMAPADTCLVAGFISDNYLDNWYVSKPLFFEFPPVIITRKEIWDQLGQPSSVNIEQLIADPRFIFGITTDQNLGPKVQLALENHQDQKNIIRVSNSKTEDSLQKMLVTSRVDYIIEYAAEIAWLKKSGQINKQKQFKTIFIDGQKNASVPVFAGCTKSDTGLSIINNINHTINSSFYQRLWSRYVDWLPDSNSQSAFILQQSELIE